MASASRSIVQPLAGHLADDADAEPGPGERLAPDDLRRQAELLADPAHLVLEQRAQRLDQRELQVVGQAADVVVGLDVRGAGAAAGLDDVRVERALHEELDRLAVRAGLGDDLARGLLEDADELAADDLALLLGVGDAGQRLQEPVLARRRP